MNQDSKKRGLAALYGNQCYPDHVVNKSALIFIKHASHSFSKLS
jgi:hypothetical protein